MAADESAHEWRNGPVAVELAAKIAAARIRTAPFPYILVNDFLPASIYADALAKWPPDTAFRTTNYERRFQMNLGPYVMESRDPAASFWRQILELSDPINRALFKKLQGHFHLKFERLFGPDWRSMLQHDFHVSYREAHLAQYPHKGGLHPHVDSPRLAVNSFLYVSETDTVEPEIGTILYRSFGFSFSENNFTMKPALQQRFLSPDVVIPYRRNSLFAFVNTPYAFHGVNDFDIGARVRRIILFSPVIRELDKELEATFRRKPPTIDFGDA